MCETFDVVWIFGYGSLIWRPGFPFVKKFNGFIKGYVRRFWQGSTDHRGVPGAPGRVVTILPSDAPDAVTWGTAYCLPEDQAATILKNLDYREKGGYTRELVEIHVSGVDTPAVKGAILYVGTETNEEYLGPAPTISIAQQIATAVGPSGPNRDYLFNLAESLRQMCVHDDHVFELETLVRELIGTASESSPTESIITSGTGSGTGSGRSKLFLSQCKDQVEGAVVVDDGAVQAISQRGKSLLPAGILAVHGVFGGGAPINVIDRWGLVVARGIINFSSEEVEAVKGHHSSKIVEILGKEEVEAVVEQANMILV